jgi:hypothetical protein
MAVGKWMSITCKGCLNIFMALNYPNTKNRSIKKTPTANKACTTANQVGLYFLEHYSFCEI